MKIVLLLVLAFISEIGLCAKENYYYKKQPRNSSVEVGFSSGYNFITSSEEIEAGGLLAQIEIGIATSYFDKWLIDGRFHYITGPHNKQRMKVDFTGNSISRSWLL